MRDYIRSYLHTLINSSIQTLLKCSAYQGYVGFFLNYFRVNLH